MKVYAVLQEVIEVEIPYDTWEEVMASDGDAFVYADVKAHENLRWICENNPLGFLAFRHYRDAKDAQEFVDKC